jgi:hypothetical protein
VTAIEPLRIDLEVEASPEHAFDTWTLAIDTWWPADHTVTGTPRPTVVLEPRVGGRLYEQAPDGTEHEWGEVVAWERPHRFAYLWHLRRDRADATDVEIRFTPLDDGRRTRIEIIHTGWERLGAGGQDWRDRNLGGWSTLLPHLRAALAGREVGGG